MKNGQININQSVAILCDGNNIERSIQALTQSNAMLNFDAVIPRILSGRSLNRLIYFREGRNISSRLAERLHENFFGSVVPCHKSADIPLSIKATQLASKVDTIVIMSGDSDYVDLVRHLKSEGVRVEIVAVRDNAAKILLDEADFFHPISKADSFEYNKTRQYQRPEPRTQNPDKQSPDRDSQTVEPSVQEAENQQQADVKQESVGEIKTDIQRQTAKVSDEKKQTHLDVIKEKLLGRKESKKTRPVKKRTTKRTKKNVSKK